MGAKDCAQASQKTKSATSIEVALLFYKPDETGGDFFGVYPPAKASTQTYFSVCSLACSQPLIPAERCFTLVYPSLVAAFAARV